MTNFYKFNLNGVTEYVSVDNHERIEILNNVAKNTEGILEQFVKDDNSDIFTEAEVLNEMGLEVKSPVLEKTKYVVKRNNVGTDAKEPASKTTTKK